MESSKKNLKPERHDVVPIFGFVFIELDVPISVPIFVASMLIISFISSSNLHLLNGSKITPLVNPILELLKSILVLLLNLVGCLRLTLLTRLCIWGLMV